MQLHVHKDEDALEVEQAAREFIANAEDRQCIFGAY